MSNFLGHLVTQDTFIDQFNLASYSNNNGSRNFSVDWTVTNDDDNATGGRIEILGNELKFRNLDNRSISRNLGLSEYTGCTLTLDYNQNSGD